MHAWLDVTAGVAGDMLMGALIDAGADLAAVQAAVRAVAGADIVLRSEQVTRAGLRATKLHVDIAATGGGSRSWPQLRATIEQSDLHPATRELSLRTLQRLGEAYGRGHRLQADAVTMHEVAALDVLTDIVGDCEALRLLGVDSVSASPVALGSGRIRTSHGDLPVPVPAVAELALGWDVSRPAPIEHSDDPAPGAPQALRDDAGDSIPLGHITAGVDGVVSEGPAQVVGRGELGELATPTGMALLRCFAQVCEPLPAMTLRALGVGAGGRDVPARPNVVRVLLGQR
ncbi:MAG: LarC family nickel insertion protein [Micropruina sp.]|nr:LarC family nickel insertion protein [Micropruina sp.]